MVRNPSWSDWSLLLLLLLAVSVLLPSAVADSQCSNSDGFSPACGNFTCPFGACTSCSDFNGVASPSCDTSGAAAGAAALATGVIVVIILIPLIACCVTALVIVCCIRGLCCFQGSRATQRWQQRGVVHNVRGPVAVYGSSGPTTIFMQPQTAVSSMQMSGQPLYAQPVSPLHAQPVMYAGSSQAQYAQQAVPCYAAPQQQYPAQPQPVSYQPQQQQWQQNSQQPQANYAAPPPYAPSAQYAQQRQEEWSSVEK